MSESKRRHPKVINLDEVEPKTQEKGSRFGCTTRWLGRSLQARGVGCSWYEVPPGKAAFPLHFHCANEEAVFVLEGQGTLRIGAETVPLRAGDYVSFPPGPEHAHQILNTGTGPLRYLGLSTLLTTDVVGYPDSGKLAGMSVRYGPDGQPMPVVRAVFRQDSQVDYYDGEKTE
jgi:uncharacterized cupin superfamily protein